MYSGGAQGCEGERDELNVECLVRVLFEITDWDIIMILIYHNLLV